MGFWVESGILSRKRGVLGREWDSERREGFFADGGEWGSG